METSNQPTSKTLNSRRTIAVRGEELALKFIIARGYRPIATNYRLPYRVHRGELDIIAMDGSVLSFVEVKTRRSIWSNPSEAVGPAKRRQIIALAEAYLAINRCAPSLACRFDVVAVILPWPQRAPISIELFKNAFWPE